MLGIRELRGDLALHVRRAAAGARTVITVGGRPAAVIGPLNEASAGGVEPLVASGALLPPRRTDPSRLAAPIAVWSGARLDRLLRELRG